MSLRFVVGVSGSGKSACVYRELIERSKADPAGKFYVIVPDQFSLQTQLDLVTMHEKKGIMNIDVLSFGRLTHRVFEEVGGVERPMLDDTGKSLIVRRVASKLQDQLPLIGGNLNKVGYVHEVKSVLSEFMQYGVGRRELELLTEFATKRGMLCQKLQELALLYDGYLRFLQDRYLTMEESLTLLARLLPSSNLFRDSVIVFDGFTGFTPVQNRVIRQLLSLAKEVTFTLTMDDGTYNRQVAGEQELFFLSKKTQKVLCAMAREDGIERGRDLILSSQASPRFQQSPRLAWMERNLFRYPCKVYAGGKKEASSGRDDDPAFMEGNLSIMEASGQQEEVRQICIAIRRLTNTQGYAYRDIAVICSDLNAYAGCMEQIFTEYDIPVYLDMTRKITLNPFIEYIKSALRICFTDYSYEAVFHYLRSGLADFTPEETDRLENYVLALGIRGRKKWESRFTYQWEELVEPEAELEELNQLRERLVAQLSPLFATCKVMRDYARSLYTFLVDNRVQQKLKAFEINFAKQKDPVREREYAQIYRLVMDLLDQIVDLIGDEAAKPEEFFRILEAGFEEIQVGTLPLNVDRVILGDMERTRLKPVKVLFFAGVNDGFIPKAAQKGGLISDLDREFLLEAGQELAPSGRQQMYIQRFYLYLNMTKPSEKLILSYARMSREGTGLRPSYLIGQLQGIFPDLRILRPEEADPLEQIQTLQDGRSFFARQLRSFADGELGQGERARDFFGLYRLFSKDQVYGIWSGKLADTAFFKYRENSLGKTVALALYGQTLAGSVSRMEQYAACAYAHFLRYGLGLKAQGDFSFEAVDLGNLFHSVLELFAKRLEESGYTWLDFPKEEGRRLVEEAVENCCVSYRNTVLYDNARNLYIIARMKRILIRTVEAMQYQLKKGNFLPEHFEVSFSQSRELASVNIALSEGEKMRLRGRIDRLDVCKKQEAVYVKVVDYKSGSRDFSLAALYYGLQLQLVVYLNAGMEMVAQKHPDKKVVPAAMLYYRVQDPLLDVGNKEPTIEEIQAQILRSLRTTGLVNQDAEVVENLDTTFVDQSDAIPVERKKDGAYSARSSVLLAEDFGALSAFVNQRLKKMGQRILEGDIALNPYEQGDKSACDFCIYKRVCGFEEGKEGYRKRKLEALKDEEALLRIRREVEDGGEIYTGPEAGD